MTQVIVRVHPLRVNSRNDLCHDDSTINIVKGVVWCNSSDQEVTGLTPSISTFSHNPEQLVHTHARVTEQYKLVLARGHCSNSLGTGSPLAATLVLSVELF